MGKQKGSDQTEKPTPKKLKDARKEGEVHKSQDLSKTVSLLLWFGLFSMFIGFIYRTLSSYFDYIFDDLPHLSVNTLLTASAQAGSTLMKILLPFIAAAALLGTLVEFLQVGVIFAPKRISPKMERINPADGLKRIFSQENFIEVIKSILKTAALLFIFLVILRAMARDYLMLPMGDATAMFATWWQGIKYLLATVITVFFFIAILDVVYQRHVFMKNMMMSMRDIKQEVKDNEGDPMLKSQRRQLHQEWSQQNMLAAVRKANAVVVNPTHIAVALYYDADETGIPMVVAKGEGYMARQIREIAEEAGVPVMQNIDLARGLYGEIEENTYISADFFEAVAEVLKWAEEVRQES